MKEKIKILQNEVEILRNESVTKDKALSKERREHQQAQHEGDRAVRARHRTIASRILVQRAIRCAVVCEEGQGTATR